MKNNDFKKIFGNEEVAKSIKDADTKKQEEKEQRINQQNQMRSKEEEQNELCEELFKLTIETNELKRSNPK